MTVWLSNLSIKSKLLLLSIAVSSFVLIAFGLGLYSYQKSSFYKDREEAAVRLADITSKNLVAAISFADIAAIKEFLDIVSGDEDFTGALILDDKEQKIFQAGMIESESAELNLVPYDSVSNNFMISRNSTKFALQTYVLLEKRRIGRITMFFSYNSAREKLNNFAEALSLSLAFAMLLGALVSIRLQRMITHRLLEILSLIKEISSSRDYSLTIDNIGSDEIGVLGQNFNLMLSEINQRDLSLRLANLSLESRVQERTHELEVAVENLKAAQQQIFNKHQQLLNVVSNAPIAMAMFDRQKNLIVFSNKWKELFGLCELKQPQQNLSLYFPDSWEEAYQSALNGQANSANEDYFKNAGSATVFIRWTVQPWLEQDWSVGGAIISAEDISDLVKARDAAIKVAKTRTEFMANVSHELRTPLNGILGFASVLEESSNDPEQKEHLSLIRSSGETLLRTINDVLDFSKLERGNSDLEKISFSPAKLLTDLQKLFTPAASSKHNQLELRLDPIIPDMVLGDEFRLRQVLTNLLGNANKFTINGRIQIDLTLSETSDSSCRLKFSVQDSGIGIPEDKISEVFKPFSQADGSVTRKYGGTGLGLSIASSLVAAMGGELKVQSSRGSGSTFYFEICLPVDQSIKSQRLDNGGRAVPGDALNGKRILLAEDNHINLKLVAKILEKSGCKLTAVDDGQKAVDVYQAEKFDLVILDLQMPVMGGLEACKIIREHDKKSENKIPIVALTAHAFEDDRIKCIEAGMNSFLTKPINKQDLILTLSELVNKGC